MGHQVSLPRRSRRVSPHPGQGVCACGLTKGLSARPLETFGHRSWREPHGTPNPPPQPESTHQAPQQRIFLRHSCRTPMQAGGFLRGKRSARIALPCAPLVGYLNFRLLSDIGSHTRRVHDFLSASPPKPPIAPPRRRSLHPSTAFSKNKTFRPLIGAEGFQICFFRLAPAAQNPQRRACTAGR